MMIKRSLKKYLSYLFILIFIIQISIPMEADATQAVTPYVTKMYSTSGTPVYAKPDINSPILVIVERFIQINVTGITANGFYQVDLGGTFYIPGPFLVEKKTPDKTPKQLALEQIDSIFECYTELLAQLEPYISAYALMDVTGDGVPEILLNNKKEIYTYHDKHPVVVYYCQEPTEHYYHESTKTLIGKYRWFDKDVWEVYFMDYSLLPWGQIKCCSTDAVQYKENAKKIEYNYVNDVNTRSAMKDKLKELLSK